MQLLMLQSSQRISESEFRKWADQFRERFPTDPSADIIAVEYFGSRKQFDVAIDCINRVDLCVGGDPLLPYFRGKVYAAAENWPFAKREYLRALDHDAAFSETYWGLVEVCLKLNDHVETLRWVKKAVEVSGIELDRESNADETRKKAYREFTKTPEYEEFTRWYKSRPKKYCEPTSDSPDRT